MGKTRFLTTLTKSNATAATGSKALNRRMLSFESRKQQLQQRFESSKGSYLRYAVWGGVGIAVFLVVDTGYKVAHFMSKLDILEVSEGMFLAGLFTAFVVTGVTWIGYRSLALRGTNVLRALGKRIPSEAKVVEELGGTVSLGKFQAYSYVDGTIRWKKEPGVVYDGWDRFWKPRKLHVFFQVQGPKARGMITAEAQKDFKGNLMYNVIAMDVLETGKRVVIEGSADKVLYDGVFQKPI